MTVPELRPFGRFVRNGLGAKAAQTRNSWQKPRPDQLYPKNDPQGSPECPNPVRGFWDTPACSISFHARRSFCGVTTSVIVAAILLQVFLTPGEAAGVTAVKAG